MAHRFELVRTDGEILESIEMSKQRWQTGDTVIAHGNSRQLVVLVVERTA